MRFAIFPVHLSKLLRLPPTSDARSYEVLHLSRKIISANLKIWGSKMQPFSWNQRTDLLTSLVNMSLDTAPVTENAFLLILFKCLRLVIVFCKCYKTRMFCSLLTRCTIRLRLATRNDTWTSKSGREPLVLLTFWLRNVLRATTACTFSTSQLPKVVRDLVCFVKHFDFEIVLRATTACTFSTSQLPKVFRTLSVLCSILTCEMCFVPQRRALFQHRNFQKRSEHVVLCSILTWKCASRHNGVQFFISHLARWLRTRHFSEPTFRPSGATNHRKNIVFRDFPTFSRTCIFFLLTLSLLWSSLAFYSSLLFSASSHLCFSSVHIVGSLTSKLPWVKGY